MNEIQSMLFLIMMILGTVNSLMNIIIYRSKKFRLNSCIFYLLCSTIFDWIYILSSCLIRLNENQLEKSNFHQRNFICKMRIYILVISPTLSTCYLMLASIDRCLSTSLFKKWRNLSNKKISHRISLFTLIFILLINFHIIYFHRIETNKQNSKCFPSGEIYRKIYGLFVLISNPFVVYLIMFICTMKTLIRIRQSKMKFLLNERRNGRLDRHLIEIIFIHIGLGMLFTFIRCGFLIYILSTMEMKKSSKHLSIDLLLDQITIFIYYFNFIKSFPLNILTSQLFRNVFKQQIQAICRSNQSNSHRYLLKSHRKYLFYRSIIT